MATSLAFLTMWAPSSSSSSDGDRLTAVSNESSSNYSFTFFWKLDSSFPLRIVLLSFVVGLELSWEPFFFSNRGDVRKKKSIQRAT